MVEIREENGFGILLLKRPDSLNALTLGMVEEALGAVRRWEASPSIRALWLGGRGEKGFCAGGDVRLILADPSGMVGEAFFRTEYALDLALHRSSKPVVALGNGFVIGGGMGLFQGGHPRLVTETTRALMPEIRIGFFPDVGTSWFFGRLPKPMGLFLALTGSELSAEGLLDLGLADLFLKEEAARGVLASPPPVRWSDDPAQDRETLLAALMPLTSPPPQTEAWKTRKAWVLGSFPKDFSSVREVLAFFAKHASHPDPWVARAMKEGREASPHSLGLILKLFRETDGKSLEECFAFESEMAKEAASHPDFREGVRARLIDRDQRPRWKSPART